MNTSPTTTSHFGSKHLPNPAEVLVSPKGAPSMLTPQAGDLLVREVAPRIRSLVPSMNPVGAEDMEELAQDAVTIAASLLKSAQARGKKVSVGNITYYALRHIKQGRRSTSASKTDVMHPATQIAGRSCLISMDAPVTEEVPGEEPLSLHDVLAGRAEDPSMAASRRLDWEKLSVLLDPAVREVLRCLAKGEDVTTLVPKLRRSRSALQTDKARLARLVREHLGTDILSQVQTKPRWMNNIEAERERRECRLAARTL